MNSRCITLNTKELTDTIALAPFLDCLNHSLEASVDTFYDPSSQSFKISTRIPYQKDSQVFISYGPHDNHFLLTEYGFVLPGNRYDYVDCADQFWTHVERMFPKTAPIVREKALVIIETLGIAQEYVITREGIGYSLLTLARLAVLPVQDLDRLTTRHHQILYDDGYFSSQHESLCRELLGSIVDHVVQDYQDRIQRMHALNDVYPVLMQMSADMLQSDIDLLNQSLDNR